jgi:hydrogenase-4 component B
MQVHAHPIELLLALAALFWLLVPISAVLARRDTNHGLWSIWFAAGAVSALGAAFTLHGARLDLTLPLGFGQTFACLRLDPLAGWYLGVIGLVAVLIAPYLRGYMASVSRSADMRVCWIALSWLLLSMAGTVLAANAQTFLVAWEVMSLTSYLLVATDHEQPSAKQSALIYLGATRVGTALLAIGFVWAHAVTGSWNFADWHLQGAAALGPGLLILAGLGVKAGMWPFHLWLPVAHPAAPSPVSALMSGVMVKVATAVIVRLFVVDNAFVDGAFGYTILCLGAVGSLWGVLFALMQHDLKRLLAFHTVENVGLIFLGIGLSLVARGYGLLWISEIALAAALFHVLNHALFKSLLFLGAGAVDSRAGTRELGLLGGLGKRMPVTYACFTIGAAAICGLPPLNGFASEWLLYQGLLHCGASDIPPVMRFACFLLIGLIALVGVLAMACFVKAVGVIFQGRPRSTAAEKVTEVGAGMRASQALMALCCVALGIAPSLVLKMIQPIVGANGAPLESAWTIPTGSLIAVLAATFLAVYLWMNRAAESMPARSYVTWECGFGPLSPRMQVSATSFVQPIARMFRAVFRYAEVLRIEGMDKRLFPDEITAVTSSESVLETRIYRPVARLIWRLGDRVLRLQEGSIHRYLMLMAATLAVLLIIGGCVH